MKTFQMKFPARSVCLLVSLLLVGVVGCGGAKKGKVEGKVTYDGKRVTFGKVNFIPKGKGTAVTAEIDSEGHYSVDKVPVGEVTITVETGKLEAKMRELTQQIAQMGSVGQIPKDATSRMKKDQKAPEIDTGGDERTNRLKDLKEQLEKIKKGVEVPEAYSKAETSGVTYTVETGDQTHDIELKKK
jgi:hypothetical protein